MSIRGRETDAPVSVPAKARSCASMHSRIVSTCFTTALSISNIARPLLGCEREHPAHTVRVQSIKPAAKLDELVDRRGGERAGKTISHFHDVLGRGDRLGAPGPTRPLATLTDD